MGAQLRLGDLAIGLQHDAGEDLLPVIGVWNADGRGLEDRRMQEQRLVDLTRRNILAPLDDELLQPSGDEEIALCIATAKIATAQEALLVEGIGALLRRFVIAAHHIPAAQPDLA